MKVAILQLADQGPSESTAAMLRAVGYDVYLPDKRLRDVLRKAGCDLVLSPCDLTRGMGYDPVDLPEIGPAGMDTCDLYCDVKAHRCYPKVVAQWPRLKGRILWTRINGGKPEHVIKPSGEDCGDEVNIPCPVLTPNLWYGPSCARICAECEWIHPPGLMLFTGACPKCGCRSRKVQPWHGRAYACYPPFVRFAEYDHPRERGHGNRHYRGGYLDFEPPICLIHGINGWGYRDLIDPMRALGVRMHGVGAPDGLLQHREVAVQLSKALCMVHLKSSDAPGYALYEALAAACPVVCTRRLIWRCRMQDLLIPGETCLVFDRETHDGLTADDVRECTREVLEHLERLRDSEENRRIGLAGRERLKQVMWSSEKAEDVESLREFMGRHFP